MKTIKSILIVAALISASFVSMSAQEAAQPAKEGHQFQVSIGDSVMIKRECQRYLTGEKPSTWVWDKVHTVRQLGTKQYPDGVLLMNIYSWMCEECLVNVNGHANESAAQVQEEQAAEKAAEEARIAADEKEAEAARRAAAERAAIAAADSAFRAKEAERLAAEEEEARQAALKAQEDSIKSAQNFKGKYDRFTIGVRGGAAGLLHTVEMGKWTCGFDALLDLQYAHYWTKDGRPVDLGLIVGLGIGYSRSGMKAAVNTDTTVVDNDGMHIDYKVHADEVNEKDGQIQLEIPLMFSLIHQNGLFFNIGPKFMIPVYTPYDQTISNNPNTQISAYFQEIGVPVTNEVITGALSQNQYKTKGTDNGNQFSINVMLTGEIGYEWVLKSGNSLGLGAYANYCVYNSFKNNATSNNPLIQVTPPTTDVATVNVLSATKTYANKLGYFDAGIKLAYHFNFPKKRQFIDAQLFE